MKHLLFVITAAISSITFSQTNYSDEFKKAEIMLEEGSLMDAYVIFKSIEQNVPQSDTLYDYALWNYVQTLTKLEQASRMKENYKIALEYGLEALEGIEKGMDIWEVYSAHWFWMNKNLIVNCYGLNQLDLARKYQDVLYAAYKNEELPEGLDKYYNFEFFTWNGNNVWGYEWYPELGDPETEGSFSKIVYYVYSTSPDGTDRDQLYRLHVLKFHKFDDSVSFDYLLTKRLEKAVGEKSGSLYNYTYESPIDMNKVREDVRKVLNGEYE
ncbi:MAG: hypothetical protein QNK23_13680 [Crocinitomicaceae bacterium]|nr:hypothetical protein [Crocinitomicaceae bacterium]